MITFKKTTLEHMRPLFEAYLKTIPGVLDDFWEEHVLGSQLYAIQSDDGVVGALGLHQKENLTFFHVPQIRLAQHAFSLALDALKPRYAYAPTNDELFLSLCMDHPVKIDRQAYFFSVGDASVRPAEFSRALLTLARPEDEKDILDTEHVAENIRLGKYYIMRENGVFLGQGFLNSHQLTPNTVSIGMSVHPEHRQRGVGRSIILHLADICREKGMTPVCGCWYYNHNSKRTLESAGFITKTRLLKLWFVEGEEPQK